MALNPVQVAGVLCCMFTVLCYAYPSHHRETVNSFRVSCCFLDIFCADSCVQSPSYYSKRNFGMTLLHKKAASVQDILFLKVGTSFWHPSMIRNVYKTLLKERIRRHFESKHQKRALRARRRKQGKKDQS